MPSRPPPIGRVVWSAALLGCLVAVGCEQPVGPAPGQAPPAEAAVDGEEMGLHQQARDILLDVRGEMSLVARLEPTIARADPGRVG